ncbi:MAG: sulfotransferase family 2 domain-containing protein [Pseudomonadales bacterium]|nr:sulfotransferase family 2 domain-containing protein [Pseudomonadales bacterium]
MLNEEFSIYLERYEAVYIDIAKVASSSIKATLASVLELESADGNPHDVDFPRPPKANPDGEDFYSNLYSFAFVRNPWDRLVSCYRDKIGGEVPDFTGFAETGVAHCLARFDVFKSGMSFRDFAYAVASIPDGEADEHFRSQADYVTNSRGQVAVNFVGRYENLAEDFNSVARRIGLNPNIKLPHLQAASKRDFTAYYTPEISSLVESRYARDIELFKYPVP